MTSPRGTSESRTNRILEGIDGALCGKRTAVNNVILESQARQKIIKQQIEVKALEQQAVMDKEKR